MNARAHVLVVGIVVVSAPAFAQPPASDTNRPGVASGPGDDAVAARDAKTRFDEGLKRYAAYDYEGAWAAFAQAYAVLKSADVLWNLCMAELRSGRPLDAIRHIRAYMRDPRINDVDRSRARRYLGEAHQKTAHMLLDTPAGSTITVDGTAMDQELKTGDPVDVAHGKHKVECKQGTVAQSVEVELVVGQTVSVRFLPPSGDAPPAAPTVVTVRSRDEGVTDAGADDDAGSSPWKTILGVGFAGGAAVALGLGVGFLAASGSAKDDAVRLRSGLADPVSGCYRASTRTCNDLSEAVGDEIAFQNVSTAAFVAAGALAVGSVAVFLLWPKRSITPAVGPSGATLTGRF